jgi:hypothetical protein
MLLNKIETMKNQNLWKILFVLLIGLSFTACNTTDDIDDDTTSSLTTTEYNDAVDAATNLPALKIKDKGEGTGTITWTKDKVYIIEGFLFVNAGQTLTIEAGTVIKGKPGTGEQASALIVAKGGRINAQGTANDPIIFTAESDQLNGNLGTTSGLWGGLIILGDARLNSNPGESNIEGIPTTEIRGSYGGTNDEDNSGTLSYVSIRHGGTDIGAGNEINGLTLGGVGNTTTLNHIEIFANADDGVEYFGGTASIKYLISAYCNDDAIDYDEGYRGKNQFVFVYQKEGEGDRGGEHDGGTDPEDGNPYATPVFANVTSVSSGKAGKRCITFRDNAGGEYHNSIFVDFNRGIDIEFLASGESSYKRFAEGRLKLENNIFINTAGDDADAIFKIGTVEGKEPVQKELDDANTAVKSYFVSAGNTVGGADITRSNVIPSATNGSLSVLDDSFFINTNYKGAFAPNQTAWYSGWTIIESFVK